MRFTSARLDPDLSFGRRITGLTLDQLGEPEVRDELRRIWIEDGLVLFQEGDDSEEFQVELSQVFGPLELHPVKEVRNAQCPELIELRSVPGKDTTFEVDGVICGAWLPFHTDLIYCHTINHGGILRAVEPTSWGGQTGFTDKIDAYARLPEDLKKRIEGLSAVYQMCTLAHSPFATRADARVLSMSDYAQQVMGRVGEDLPPVAHPLVFTQAETGRKVLNFSPRFAIYLEGMDNAEGNELLHRLAQHIFDGPAYFHDWKVGELMLWDNWRMLHCVTPAPVDEVRIMKRTTIAGDYAMGRTLRTSRQAA